MAFRFPWQKPKRTYAFKKARKIERMKEKLAVLRIEKEIELLQASREADTISTKADKIGHMNDLLDEVQDLADRIKGNDASVHPLIQMANTPVGQMLISKILGTKLDISNPEQIEAAKSVLLQKAQEHPEVVQKGLKQAKAMGLIKKPLKVKTLG